MDLLKKFLAYIRHEKLFYSGQRILVAVSGGIDSVVLVHLLKSSGYQFGIAHCNFCLRGDESDLDEKFVKELAEKNKIKFHSIKFDTAGHSVKNKTGIQETARMLRYNWFREIVTESHGTNHRYDVIVTAHHADDNAETILMNFFKGTGVNGLKGISPKNENLCRPLLFARKEEIVLYAQDHGIVYREDASNATDKYTRNYYRLHVIPALEKLLPGVISNIISQSDRFRDFEIIYGLFTDKIKKTLIECRNGTDHISVLKLKNSPAYKTVMYELMSLYNFKPSQVPELEKLLDAPSGKYILSATHRLLRDRKWLIITSVKEKESDHILIEEGGFFLFPEGSLRVRSLPGIAEISKDKYKAMLDQSGIEFPLLLRKWKQGDYFYPLGMKKKKKLSRFYIDSKVSLADKEKCWIVESNKRIIWVVGYRIDERFKITDNTKQVLSMELIPKK